MNNKNPENEELQKHMAERVSLVKNSLLSAIYQNRWYKVGIKQLINRLFILFQQACAITILQKLDNGDFKVIHHTLLDPLWKTTFEEPYLNRVICEKRGNHLFVKPRIRNISAENFRFPILGDIYAMIHSIGYKEDQPKSLEFKPISLDDKRLQMLAQEINSSFAERKPISEHLKNNFIKKAEEWGNGKIVINSPQITDLRTITRLKELNIIDDQYFNRHFKGIRAIFDKEYRRIFDSPLVSENNRNPPNVFFFVKVFSQEHLRYHGKRWPNLEGTYSHGVRAVIPDTQKQHLNRAFETLLKANKKRKKNQKSLIFPVESIAQDNNGGYTYEYVNAQEKIPSFKYKDDFFWQEIAEPNGIEKVLNDMESYFGPCARSVSDSVLETGYVHVKEDPFVDGGSQRLEENEWDRGEESIDFRRLVYFHYALHMMAPKDKEICTLLIPGHVGGSPWFCMGFVFGKDQSEHTKWLDNYHFYHSVYLYVVRGVRSQIRDLYLAKIQNIYLEGQDKIVDKIVHNIPFQAREICETLNPQLEALTCVYPFVRIEFIIEDKNKSEKTGNWPDFFHRYMIESRIEFAVFFRPNSFFVQHLDGQYLDAKRVKECLLEADRLLVQKIKAEAEKKSTSSLENNYDAIG